MSKGRRSRRSNDGLEVIAACTQNAAVTGHLIETTICQDDRCTREEIHAAHRVSPRRRDLFAKDNKSRVHESHRKALRDIVRAHVPKHHCKPFRVLYNDVLNDYGDFVSDQAGFRAVWRALSSLISEGSIVSVTKDGPRSLGGYVRSDSPLLRDEDGRMCLLENLDAVDTVWP